MDEMGPIEQEKITVNLGPVDLGKIDLLVSQGAFSNRADFIRTAVRRLLDEHKDMIQTSVERDFATVGIEFIGRKRLEQLKSEGRRVNVTVVGLVHIAKDVTPELADEVFDQVRVLGVIRAPQQVIERLGDRLRVNRKSRGGDQG